MSKGKIIVGEVHLDAPRASTTNMDEIGCSAVSSITDFEYDLPCAPSLPRALDTMREAETAAMIMALKLELAEARTSMDVSLQATRDLSAANETLTSSLEKLFSSLESGKRERDHLRCQLEQTRNVVSSMQRAARRASAERAELRVQAEMLRSENERYRGYANLRDECQKLRMDNRRLKDQLAQAQQQEQELQQQQFPSKAQSGLLGYRYAHPSSSIVAPSPSSIFSAFPVGTNHLCSPSGVEHLPGEKLREHMKQQGTLPPLCTNESPKFEPLCFENALNNDERVSARGLADDPPAVPRRASLLNMLSGLGSGGAIARQIPNHHLKKKGLSLGCQGPQDDEKEKDTATSTTDTTDLSKVNKMAEKKINSTKNAAANGAGAKGNAIKSSIFSIGNRKTCPARLQQVGKSSPSFINSIGGGRKRAGGRGSIKILSKNRGACKQAGDGNEPPLRRWSGSNLDEIDLAKLYDDDDEDESSVEAEDSLDDNVPAGGILVSWRHEIVAERRAERSKSESNIGDSNKDCDTISILKESLAEGGVLRQSFEEEEKKVQEQGTQQALCGVLDNSKEEEATNNNEGSSNIGSAPAVSPMISAEDSSKVICSANRIVAPPFLEQQSRPQLQLQTSSMPHEEEMKMTYHHQRKVVEEEQQWDSSNLSHQAIADNDYDCDDRTNLTLGTADDVERFFSDMMDEDLVEEEVFQDLQGHLEQEMKK